MFDCLHVSMLDQAIAGRSAASLLSSTTRMRNDVPPEATSRDAVSGSTTPVRARGGRIASVPPWPLNNAAKYTPPGGVLRAESYVEDGQIRVVIDDNGIGMSEALMARAFDLFAQAERTADRAQGGLGIGLAVVKRLVELHDATINASSACLGKGSRFTLVFPKIAQDHALGPLAPVPESSVQQGSLKIMVVDDNVDACAQPATAHAVLIAVTGYGRDEDRRASKEAGFDVHFVKPVDSGDLAALLADIARRLRHPAPERGLMCLVRSVLPGGRGCVARACNDSFFHHAPRSVSAAGLGFAPPLAVFDQ